MKPEQGNDKKQVTPQLFTSKDNVAKQNGE